ncbi:carbohydrate kinase family protein [Lichenicoccus roseus]|uniref:Carbohydrate kinase family protein n=1 Tax=Lichenicoccus roseus TaxID=2683649 RepID=A0A5R9JGM5_9PROT|nr:carbohydrate kinase family protein [Lichenicoccus roseus]TLU74576.1 carbohydrate kinase family protein [Lichenicoccus roseus]
MSGDGVVPPPPRLVCCGNLSIDDMVHPDGSSHPGCTGGDALFGALGARLVLPETQMLAPVGCDLPQAMQHAILAAGFAEAGLPRRSRPTLHNRIVYRTYDQREVELLSSEDDFDVLSPYASDIPESFRAAEAFMILAMTLQAQRDLVAGLRRQGQALLALDPQEEYIDGHVDEILDLVAQVDLFMPSLDEVRRLLGHVDAPRAARQFAKLGPGRIVIKMGAQGSLTHDRLTDRDVLMPACPVDLVDTTGGGDAFCSAFVASLVQVPDDLVRASASGATAASFAISDFGIAGLQAADPRLFSGRRDKLMQSVAYTE